MELTFLGPYTVYIASAYGVAFLGGIMLGIQVWMMNAKQRKKLKAIECIQEG